MTRLDGEPTCDLCCLTEGCRTCGPCKAHGHVPVLRQFRSTSTYVDGFEDERTFDLHVPKGATDEVLAEILHPQSGAGHFGPDGKSVDAYYEIESIDGLEPAIHWEAIG